MLDEANPLSYSFLNKPNHQSVIPIYQLKKSTSDMLSLESKQSESPILDSNMLKPRYTIFNRRECRSTSDDSHTFEINNNEPLNNSSKLTKIDLIRDELLNSTSLSSKLNGGKFGFNPIKKSNFKNLFSTSNSSSSVKKSNMINNLNLFNTNKSNVKRLNTKHFIDSNSLSKKTHDYNHNKKLFHAVIHNEYKNVSELLDSAMYDVNCYDDKQRTCLHIACSRGYLEIVRLLLEYGADPNIRDCVSNLPIHLAIISSHVPVVTILLEAGADIHSLDTNGKTVLHLAGTRLRWLLNDENHTASPKLKFEAIMIMNMIKEYLRRKKTPNTNLDLLADQLENSFNLDDINSLTKQFLNQFESFNLDGKNQCEAKSNNNENNVINIFKK
ncbi:unnamed protein product [Brachionus calyciflorus]|uniref:Uncharacterized protein n=1 Tax=Brachionus calyciflorus TaxID=104777 RepID=A0A813TYZ3_9BILA|nr:unnamed protein product [Brachionus calyciflorus]